MYPFASALLNVTIPAYDPSINYQPNEGVWNAIGDSGARNGAFMLARTQNGFATISKSFRGFHFTAPLWPYPVKMAISIDSSIYVVDLQDYSAATTTPPATGMTPSSNPSQIWFSFHDTDAQRTVKVSSRSSSTGWTAVVESFIFEIAQPGDAPVSVSSWSPPQPHDDGSGNSGSINLGNTPDSPSPTGSDSSGTSGISLQGSITLSPSASGLNIIGPIIRGSTKILDGVPGISTTGSATSDSNHLNNVLTAVYSVSSPLGPSLHFSSHPNPVSTSAGPGTDSASDHAHQHKHTTVILISVICGTVAILAIVLGLLYFRRRQNLLKSATQKQLPVGDVHSIGVAAAHTEDEGGDPEQAIQEASGEGLSSIQNPFDDAYAEHPRVFGDLDNTSSISLGDVIQHAMRVSISSLRGSMKASVILAAPGVVSPPESSANITANTLSQTPHDHPSVEFSSTTSQVHSTTEMVPNSESSPEPTCLPVNSNSRIASLQWDETRAPRRANIPPPLFLSPPTPPTPATAPPHYSQLSPWASSDDNNSQQNALSLSIITHQAPAD
ncbi:hypothetical protein BJ165DRAFT_1410092 [Panaeolus papilionaceus]|nr:hypothetical protein BJ165DRAFT_1410092 [Panaeolus papilionaceus]